jgi:hypothetical protein
MTRLGIYFRFVLPAGVEYELKIPILCTLWLFAFPRSGFLFGSKVFCRRLNLQGAGGVLEIKNHERFTYLYQ